MKEKTVGVLAMAYGTPTSLDGVEEYYTHIRHGRKPTPEQLEELINRYKRIGGVSPLNEITRKQTDGLANILNSSNGEITFRVYTGLKHTKPFIEDTVKQMAADGIEKGVGFVFAPHYSSMSVGTYISTAEKSCDRYEGPSFSFIKQWHMQPQYLRAMEKRLREAFNHFSEEERKGIHLLFTAHSLPERILKMQDPYPDQLRETSVALAEKMEYSNWSFAWQSAGRTPEPWLGPDILEVLRQLAQNGTQSVIICPIGFVADHLEVIYDIDVECQALASQLGIKLARTRMLNADSDFLHALAAIIRDQVKEDWSI